MFHMKRKNKKKARLLSEEEIALAVQISQMRHSIWWTVKREKRKEEK